MREKTYSTTKNNMIVSMSCSLGWYIAIRRFFNKGDLMMMSAKWKAMKNGCITKANIAKTMYSM